MPKNKYLEIVTKTAEMLLSSDKDELEETLLKGMDLLARSIDADRMYIWRKQFREGKLQYERLYKWFRHDEPGNNQLIIDSILKWDNIFSAGECINGPVSSLSEAEQAILTKQNVKSILLMPLFIHERNWGFVSFDDCRRERSFSDDEIRMLHSGSLLLANAIVREQNKIMIDTRMRQQELMAEISRSFISRESMGNLIHEAMRKIGEFLKVTRVVVVVTENKTAENRPVYVWVSAEEWQLLTIQSGFSEIINDTFPRTIPGSGFITAICCNDIINEYRGKYKKFEELNIKSFIWAPVYIDGVFWGIISAEDCENLRTWSESDVQLMGTVSSAIAGAVARDLMDRARTAALEEAVQASRAKGNFLANMSHEIRTPINAIIGMTVIGKNSKDIQKKDYALEKIENASSHLLGVINDILDVSKIEANKFELSMVTYDFEDMLQKVTDVISFRTDERRQELTIHIDKQIPQLLIGDDLRLANVITNLLSNAAKFTPEQGAIRFNAKLIGEETAGSDCTIQIEVIDTGIGIDKKQQENIFFSFEQADSGTSRKFGGTGLGLAISRGIVELMGGRIWVESEPGKGSTFAFTFRSQRGSSTKNNMLAPQVSGKNIGILAVDNSSDALESLGNIITGFGFRCDTAGSAEEALTLAEKKGQYDLCFIDWKIPGMDLIKKCASAAVIMLPSTGRISPEKEAGDTGKNEFLFKPVFPSTVAKAINRSFGVADPGEAQKKLDEQETDNFSGYTVLFAEDIEINREIVTTLLEPTALVIECAENGREAVEKFEAAPEKYSLILMDVQMPEMDGYEATRKIRAMDNKWAASVPIVAMTANVFQEDIEKCHAAGMNDHLGKPLKLNGILLKLRKYLTQSS